jgi:hypothetical protein
LSVTDIRYVDAPAVAFIDVHAYPGAVTSFLVHAPNGGRPVAVTVTVGVVIDPAPSVFNLETGK